MSSSHACLALGLLIFLISCTVQQTMAPYPNPDGGVVHHQPGEGNRISSLIDTLKQRVRANKTINIAMMKAEQVGRGELLSLLVHMVRAEVERDEADKALREQDAAEEYGLYILTLGSIGAWMGSLAVAVVLVCCVLKKRGDEVRVLGEDVAAFDIALANMRRN